MESNCFSFYVCMYIFLVLFVLLVGTGQCNFCDFFFSINIKYYKHWHIVAKY